MSWEGLNPPYRTIVADPPWPTTTGPEWGSSGPSRPLAYSVMAPEEIAGLGVRALAAEASHLYLWTTNQYLEDAFEIVRLWGFRPSTVLVWCKRPHGLGMGGTHSLTTEFCLFARRRILKALGRSDTTWHTWPRGAHSVKPPAFYDLVERVSPGPYLELFARQPRLGWDSWGWGYEEAKP